MVTHCSRNRLLISDSVPTFPARACPVLGVFQFNPCPTFPFLLVHAWVLIAGTATERATTVVYSFRNQSYAKYLEDVATVHHLHPHASVSTKKHRITVPAGNFTNIANSCPTSALDQPWSRGSIFPFRKSADFPSLCFPYPQTLERRPFEIDKAHGLNDSCTTELFCEVLLLLNHSSASTIPRQLREHNQDTSDAGCRPSIN